MPARHPPSRREGPGAAARRALVALLCLATGACAGDSNGTATTSAGFGGRPLIRPSNRLSLESGETVPELLARGGLSAPEVRRLLDRIRPYADWTTPDRALEARFHRWPGEPPERLELRIDRDRTLDFTLRGAVWDVDVDSVSVRYDTVVVSGVLDGSLYSAHLAGDEGRLSIAEKADLAAQLADVYAWQIDFYRDPRPGDAFRLAVERARRPDGSLRGTTVLAAEYARGERYLQAFRFVSAIDAEAHYYDGTGIALRGAFLKAPIDLVRVTSRFAKSRYHPVLRSVRSHTGVDYGAPSGTPVRATGDGTIVRAGWAGDLGLLIELDHGRGVRTRYAHLGGVSDVVHRGGLVGQGDVIGVVGSTGLSTAPHLHYEFRLHGLPVNPASVDLPVQRPIPPADSLRFDEARGSALKLLGRTFWPGRNPGSLVAPADSPGNEP